jgi:Flp pilus assembly protein TadD
VTSLTQVLQMGWNLHQQGDFAGAENIYRQVLVLDPTSADACCYLGILYFDLERFAESIAAYQQALQLRPRFPIALSNLGNSLTAVERFAEAEAALRQALQLQPDYANAWSNLGATLVKQGRWQAAEQCFERALAIAPQSETAHRNLGAALVRQGKLEQGQRHSEHALQLNPRSAEAHRNRAIVWLLKGDWQRGWEEYEWRWQCPEQKLPNLPQPLWNGEPLEGRRLLLCAEQGLGDTLQFMRYAQLARQRGAHVVLEVQRALLPLLQRFEHADQIVPRGEKLPADLDFFLPLLSAPRVFGTRLNHVPADVPYLTADPHRVERWRAELQRIPARLRIGLVWQGSRKFAGDRERSAPLEAFLPLALPGVQWISLQKGDGSEQARALREKSGGLALLDLEDRLDADAAFVDTAAILSVVDLLISVDTSVAHLAGALAVPLWLALPATPPDWRWLLDRSDSPWYPTARLFRQTQPGDWKGVFQAMADQLRRKLENG